MRLKQTKAIQSNFSTQCDDWYIFGVIGLEIAKNVSNHAVFLEKCNENEVFDSLRRTSCDVRLFVYLHGYSSGTSVSMNGTSVLHTASIALDICRIRYCRGDVPTFLTNRLIRLPLVE